MKELDLSMYKKDGYYILGSYIWMDEKVPHGIVVLGKDGEDRHYGGGTMYAISFQYEPDITQNKDWKIKTETRFEDTGFFGKPADSIIFLKLGTNNFGFAVLNTDVSQGYFSKELDIYALINGNYKWVGECELATDNSGAVEKYSPEYASSESKIFIIENKDKQFYDIKIKTTSTKGNLSLPEQVKTLVFKNGQYEENNSTPNK